MYSLPHLVIYIQYIYIVCLKGKSILSYHFLLKMIYNEKKRGLNRQHNGLEGGHCKLIM